MGQFLYPGQQDNTNSCLRKSSHTSVDSSFISLCLDDCCGETDEEQTTLIKDVAGIVYMGKKIHLFTFFAPLKARLQRLVIPRRPL